jgi:DNA transformation protein
MSKEIESLLNLGPKSTEWLVDVGVTTLDDLKKIGPVEAYWRVKQAGYNASLNLLYALAGAVSNTHWNKLSQDEKHRMMIELDAREQQARMQQ